MPLKDRDAYNKYRREKYKNDPAFRQTLLNYTKKWNAENKQKVNEYRAGWAKQDRKKKYAKYRLYEIRKKLKRYGLKEDWYDIKFKEQDGVCAICRNPETGTHPTTKTLLPLSIDHNHHTMRARGLLCWKCNTRLHAADEHGWLEKAMHYLKKHET